MLSTLSLHPDIVRLNEERQKYADCLAGLLSEWQEIRDEINPEILRKYNDLFREEEIALQTNTLKNLELGRREELFRTKIERGERLTKQTILLMNTMVDKEFARMRRRMDESLNMTLKERNQVRMQRLQKEEEQELPRLFRTIVKKLHPDAQEGEKGKALSPEQAQFWQTAQEAYKAKNVQRLRSIHELVRVRTANEDVLATMTKDQLETEVNNLRERVSVEEKRLKSIKKKEPFCWKECIDDEQWIHDKRDELAVELERLSKEITLHQEFLDSLVGETWQDFVHKLEEEQKALDNAPTGDNSLPFIDEFIESTYFNFR
jgi:hypothetical protein